MTKVEKHSWKLGDEKYEGSEKNAKKKIPLHLEESNEKRMLLTYSLTYLLHGAESFLRS